MKICFSDYVYGCQLLAPDRRLSPALFQGAPLSGADRLPLTERKGHPVQRHQEGLPHGTLPQNCAPTLGPSREFDRRPSPASQPWRKNWPWHIISLNNADFVLRLSLWAAWTCPKLILATRPSTRPPWKRSKPTLIRRWLFRLPRANVLVRAWHPRKMGDPFQLCIFICGMKLWYNYFQIFIQMILVRIQWFILSCY